MPTTGMSAALDPQDVFDNLFGSANVDACASWLADAIDVAIAIGGGWSVTLKAEHVLLNVGPVRLLNMSAGGVWFPITRFSGRLPKWIEVMPERDVSGVLYKSVPVVGKDIRVSSSDVARLPEDVRRAFFSYVEEAARRRKGPSLFVASHSHTAVAFLNAQLDRNLPLPPGAATAPSGNDAEADGEQEQRFREGEYRTFALGRRERDRGARQACIAAHGTRCAACGISFLEQYGEVGRDFIEVHHLDPLAEADGERDVDPVRDLVPVCPNCHRMMHYAARTLGRILTPQELAAEMAKARRNEAN